MEVAVTAEKETAEKETAEKETAEMENSKKKGKKGKMFFLSAAFLAADPRRAWPPSPLSTLFAS